MRYPENHFWVRHEASGSKPGFVKCGGKKSCTRKSCKCFKKKFGKKNKIVFQKKLDVNTKYTEYIVDKCSHSLYSEGNTILHKV